MPLNLSTLEEAAMRYRLHNSGISNADIAKVTQMENQDSDPSGTPYCCFFSGGYLAAIRTSHDEIAIFHTFQSARSKIGEIADLIPVAEYAGGYWE